MAVTTRLAVLDDAAILHDLAARTFVLACPPGTLATDIDAFVDGNLSRRCFETYLRDEHRILLLAEDDGVPVGVQLVARPNDEGTLLSVAAQLEAEIGWPERRPPVN